LGISEKLKQFQQLAGNHEWLGLLYLDKGKHVKAKEHLEKGIETCKKAGSRGE